MKLKRQPGLKTPCFGSGCFPEVRDFGLLAIYFCKWCGNMFDEIKEKSSVLPQHFNKESNKMATAMEVMEIVDYVFDSVCPKIKEETRDEFSQLLIDELVTAGFLEIEEDYEESDVEVKDSDEDLPF
jgi:hypothetical protein